MINWDILGSPMNWLIVVMIMMLVYMSIFVIVSHASLDLSDLT